MVHVYQVPLVLEYQWYSSTMEYHVMVHVYKYGHIHYLKNDLYNLYTWYRLQVLDVCHTWWYALCSIAMAGSSPD
jgi:hypothetical protein